MQERSATQGRQGRGRNGGYSNERRSEDWRYHEGDDAGRFMNQSEEGGRSFSRGGNDNWRSQERDDRGRFTEQGYPGSRDYGDFDDNRGSYGRARNQGQDYGAYNAGEFEGGYRNFDREGGYVPPSQARSGWQNQFDDDYYQWRNEQIGKFDEDYRTWQNERRQKFADEFDKWRQERSARGDAQKDNKK